ncbi:MAG: hypothetical protein U0572_10805 [Phycisphaerales bacterium]
MFLDSRRATSARRNASRRNVATATWLALGFVIAPFAANRHTQADSPFATGIVSYVAGIGAASGYTNPQVALGSPERMTGDGFAPQVVTPFQPAFLSSEIVSLGMGGSLVVTFDHDVLDDPANPYGIDLLVFGNAFASDAAWPSGLVGGMFAEGGAISVSLDGVTWTPVPNVVADGPFPTLGYVDVGPYATAPGAVLTDFTRPVNPALRGPGMIGRAWPSLIAAYGGSGGGAGIDIGALGLDRIRYVRVDGSTSFGVSPEVDAFADVAPELPSPDLDGNGAVDAADLAMLLGAWGTSGGAADLDANGVVDAADLAILLGSWT